MDWPQQIATLVFVKQALAKVDKQGLWPHHLPAVAAAPSQIIKTEERLGFPLDSRYAAFLSFADGWAGFYQSVDLFGCVDLMGSEKMQAAMDMLQSIDEAVFLQAGISRSDVLPIAATSFERDMFLLATPNSSVPGTILWFAGEEIDRFENFDEFFLAMVDYNREEVNFFSTQLNG